MSLEQKRMQKGEVEHCVIASEEEERNTNKKR